MQRIALFLFAATTTSLLASPPPLAVTPLAEKAPLGLLVEYTRDPGANDIAEFLLLEKASRISWQRSEAAVPNLGYSKDAWYFRFTLDFAPNFNLLPSDYILEIAYPPLDHIVFYTPNPSEKSGYSASVSGDMEPLSSRAYFDRNFTYHIRKPDKPGPALTYYIKVHTASSVQLPLGLWTQEAFVNEMSRSSSLYGLFYGIMLVMAAYNLFLFFSIRDRGYLYYVIYIFTFILFQFTLNGFSIMYLWPEQAGWNNLALPVLISLSMFTSALFSRKYLGLKTQAPRLFRLFNMYLALHAVSLPALFILHYSLAIRIAILEALPGVFLYIGSGLFVLRRGYSPAKYYLLAWCGFLIGTAMILLKSLGILPATFVTNYSQQIGSVSEVLLLSLGLGARINEFKKEKERMQDEMLASIRRTSESYSRFVPMEFLNFMEKKSITDVGLGDQVEKEFTVMFIDIRAFTELSESMTPKENFNFLNSYLRRMSPLIKRNGGFIDKYIGDAVMALFPGNPADALTAAVEIRQALTEYNGHRVSQGYRPIEIGIGIHYGRLILGTIGSDERMEGTVISDAVNVAARLEGLTKRVKAPILVSRPVYEKLGAEAKARFGFRSLGRAKVKGKADGVEILECFSADSDEQIELKHQTRQLFEFASGNLRQGMTAPVADALNRLLLVNPDDQVARLYLTKLDTLQRRGGVTGLSA